MEDFGPQALVARIENLQSTAVDGELVILHLAKSRYVGLDDIGRRIWSLLETPTSVGALCRRMQEEYRGDPAHISRDVVDFLTELHAYELIVVRRPSEPPAMPRRPD